MSRPAELGRVAFGRQFMQLIAQTCSPSGWQIQVAQPAFDARWISDDTAARSKTVRRCHLGEGKRTETRLRVAGAFTYDARCYAKTQKVLAG